MGWNAGIGETQNQKEVLHAYLHNHTGGLVRECILFLGRETTHRERDREPDEKNVNQKTGHQIFVCEGTVQVQGRERDDNQGHH